MESVLDKSDVSLLLGPEMARRQAELFDQIARQPFQVQKIDLDLAAARSETDPFKIGFAWKSVFVQAATDVFANVSMRIGTRDSIQSPFSLKQNDSLVIDRRTPEAYLHWDAQAGKTMSLLFFTDAEFRSGSQISVTGGGVSINEGSTVTGPTQVVLTAAVAAAIAPADSTRKTATIENKTGGPIYIGDVTVTDSGATEGILIPAGSKIVWRNTGALYGYSAAGGNVHRIEER